MLVHYGNFYVNESLAAVTALDKLYLPACTCEAFSLAHDAFAELNKVWSSHGVVTEANWVVLASYTAAWDCTECAVLILRPCHFSPKANKQEQNPQPG